MSGRNYAFIAVLPLLALLASCGTDHRGGGGGYASSARSTIGEGGYYKVGKPYQVAGLWYYPREDFAYVETGVASWYGPNFHGQSTANGEAYDQNAATAAHRTLQMPSVVRVTNLENGRETVVRINDRGPFARERIIDLSRRAAGELGMIGRGTAQVRVEVMPEESQRIAELAKEGADQGRLDQYLASRFDRRVPETRVAQNYDRPVPAPSNDWSSERYVAPPPVSYAAPVIETRLPPPIAVAPVALQGAAPQPVSYEVPVRSGSLFVQAGAFSQRDNAERLRAQLARFGASRVDDIELNGRMLHRVRLGPLPNADAAQATLSRLAENGYSVAQVVVE